MVRIHTDRLNSRDIVEALTEAKEQGFIDPQVHFDVLTEHGSRKRKRAFEVALGSPDGEPFIAPEVRAFIEATAGFPEKVIKRASRRYTRQNSAEKDFPRSATWHEWGHLFAFIFARDPQAIIGDYDQADSFYYQTYEYPSMYFALEVESGDGRVYNFLGDVQDWPERTNGWKYW